MFPILSICFTIACLFYRIMLKDNLSLHLPIITIGPKPPPSHVFFCRWEFRNHVFVCVFEREDGCRGHQGATLEGAGREEGEVRGAAACEARTAGCQVSVVALTAHGWILTKTQSQQGCRSGATDRITRCCCSKQRCRGL